jgi:hypothetical protein
MTGERRDDPLAANGSLRLAERRYYERAATNR